MLVKNFNCTNLMWALSETMGFFLYQKHCEAMNSIPLLSCSKKSFCRPQFLVSIRWICHCQTIVVGDCAFWCSLTSIASRTNSQVRPTNPDELSLINTLSDKIHFIYFYYFFLLFNNQFESHRKTSNSFGSVQRSFENLRTFSSTLGSLRKVVGIFGDWDIFLKSWSWRDENLTHLSKN